jgi:hypothetical protein
VTAVTYAGHYAFVSPLSCALAKGAAKPGLPKPWLKKAVLDCVLRNRSVPKFVVSHGRSVHSTPFPRGSTFSTCKRRPIMLGRPSKMLGPVPPTSTGAT